MRRRLEKPERNVPLLRKVMEHVEAHPEEWDQANWISHCGTKACFAGWALHFTGHTLTWVDEDSVSLDGRDPYMTPSDVINTACKELGITQREGVRLFDSCRTMLELREIAEEYAGERL